MPRSVLELEAADERGERLGSPVDFSRDFTVYLETLYLHGSGVNNRSGRQYQDIFFIVHIIETSDVSCFVPHLLLQSCSALERNSGLLPHIPTFASKPSALGGDLHHTRLNSILVLLLRLLAIPIAIVIWF